MLNFRKLKQDYSSNVLKDGKELHDKNAVQSAKVLGLTTESIRLSCKVLGTYENSYTCEIEIDRHDSTTIDSDCDCPHNLDCQHLAAILYYLEKHLDDILVAFSKESDLDEVEELDDEEKQDIRQTLEVAESKSKLKKGQQIQKELLEEYIGASEVLGKSPFFLPEEEQQEDKAELAIIFTLDNQQVEEHKGAPEIQLALRLPYRSKPLNILNIRAFLDALRYKEPLYIGSRRYYFTPNSFSDLERVLLRLVMDFARFPEITEEKQLRYARIEQEAFGTLLAQAFDLVCAKTSGIGQLSKDSGDAYPLPCLYMNGLEEPLRYSTCPVELKIALDYIESPAPKLLMNPSLLIDHETNVTIESVVLFECSKPGIVSQNIYYRFVPQIKRKHLRSLLPLRDVVVPEPLFGTFVENSLPEITRYAQLANKAVIDKFITLPYVGDLIAECEIQYLNGELEASLSFLYGKIKVPATPSKLEIDDILPFITDEGILSRNLTEEQKIIRDLFQDFMYDPTQGIFIAKTDKKIVEFMTEVIPQNQGRVTFNCPENLMDQFLYDETTFTLHLKEGDRIDLYQAQLKVNGHLKGVSIDHLWDCIASKRNFIELVPKTAGKKKTASKTQKILVLDLEKLAPVIQIFDELGIHTMDDHVEECPLWSLASVDKNIFKDLPVKFTMSPKLKMIQEQMLGTKPVKTSDMPKEIAAVLRSYQKEGVEWLDRLRTMHLNGILADDMGLGKTLQAIIAITQKKIENPKSRSLIVCPTSLVYNWIAEFARFNPKIKTLPIDGTPSQRKRLLESLDEFDVVVTSYSLLQKDVEIYKKTAFEYCILDEAQHIKNRTTRNARSVKMIQAKHRLILTGTPIENSLDELWSLFDFLMPGLLSSYDRFVEKYIRGSAQEDGTRDLEPLRRKVSPFILRRMKKDVLQDLPPVSEITYHCHLSEAQKKLYQSYAASAREELAQLVKKEGFERVQIHVLATLTRLKQICCHPAIFAKEKAEEGDSAKYDMLMELLQNLMEGRHKTVIFSQYTRMLQIIREDLQRQGIPFEYLDGSSKNRLDIVNKFNQDPNIPIFLVSLKAGGSGLNLTSADTVIHYDMWWNPAVENQATDRVHRIGQKNAVSSYKLVTLNTIEEKIVDLQQRKQGLVKKIVSADDEAISKLTWEEVLELLQT